MKNDLMKQLLVVGIAVVLVSIIFIPIVTSYSTRLEKQVEIVKEEDDGYSVFPDVDRYRTSYDITENQLGYHLPQIRPNSLFYQGIFHDQLKERTKGTQEDYTGKRADIRESIWTGSREDGNYTPHDPIIIQSDDDFTTENGVTAGNGTADDPYIIEGWEINSPSDTAIVVTNTRSHFIVRNCLLVSQLGTLIYNITFGTFDNIVYNGGGQGTWLQLEESANIALCNSTVYTWSGLTSYSSEHVSIINCNITCSTPGGFGHGVYLEDSPFAVLSNITVHNGFNVGVFILHNSSHNTIRDCDVFSNLVGIALLESPYQVLRNNRLYDNTYNLDVVGSKIDEYYHDIDTSNTIDGKPMYYLYNASNLVFDETMEIGFLSLINCNNITVKNYTPIHSGVGLLLVGTISSTITSCTFKNSLSAILLFGSQKISISDCYVDNAAINLLDSPNNILRNNTINAYSGFYVGGNKLEDFYQDIDQSNTINGKPMYYLVGKKNQVFKESQVGYLALVDCKNMVVTNVKISNASQGILLVHTRALIRKCEFSSNLDGVFIVNKSLVWVYDSNINNNFYGFEFYHASDAAVVRCNVSGNLVGFNFDDSHDIIIRGCSISNNGVNGFQIWDSWDNIICRNTISNNGWGGIAMVNNCRGNEILGNKISDGYSGISMAPDYMVPEHLIAPSNNNIHHNDIHHMQWVGIYIDTNANENMIHHNSINDNEEGIIFNFCKDNNVSHNNIYDNNIGMDAAFCTVDATNNWWGSEDGPSGVGPGSGDSIFLIDANVSFDPWLKKPAITRQFKILCLLACLRVRFRSLIG